MDSSSSNQIYLIYFIHISYIIVDCSPQKLHKTLSFQNQATNFHPPGIPPCFRRNVKQIEVLFLVFASFTSAYLVMGSRLPLRALIEKVRNRITGEEEKTWDEWFAIPETAILALKNGWFWKMIHLLSRPGLFAKANYVPVRLRVPSVA